MIHMDWGRDMDTLKAALVLICIAGILIAVFVFLMGCQWMNPTLTYQDQPIYRVEDRLGAGDNLGRDLFWQWRDTLYE